METKKDIRKECLTIRKGFSLSIVNDSSQKVCQRIMENHFLDSFSQVFLYSACKNEIDLSYLVTDISNSECKFFYPKVLGQEMEFYQVKSKDDFEAGSFGILEPRVNHCVSWKHDKEKNLMLLPGIAFSKEGDRVGYGKGYYDRFLETNRNFYKIGICYDAFLKESWAGEAFDIKMDCIITEKRMVKINDEFTGIM